MRDMVEGCGVDADETGAAGGRRGWCGRRGVAGLCDADEAAGERISIVILQKSRSAKGRNADHELAGQ